MFEEQDFDEISARMLSNVDDKFDKREGSVIYDATAPTALELALFYANLDMVLDETFAESASYYYLIKRAAERGITPKEETNAILKMVTTPENVSIVVGDRFNLGELNYTVIMETGVGEYQVECETAGIIGNQQLGSVLPIETTNPLNELESAEITEVLIPGEDEEDVETFRERYFETFTNQAFGGNRADYKNKVNDIDGVGACKVFRVWNGSFHPSTFIPSDTVTEWVNNLSPETIGEEIHGWITAVHNAAKEKLLTVGGTVKVIIISSEFKVPSSTLVETVQNEVDPTDQTGEGLGTAPIGHVVNVSGVVAKIINVSANLTFHPDYSFSTLKDVICETIDDYFSELSQGWGDEDNLIVRVSQIETRILKITGIIDIANVKLNDESSNITLAVDEIPVRGDVIG